MEPTSVNLVSAMSRKSPARSGLVPPHLGNLGLEQRVLVQVVPLADHVKVRTDFGGAGVTFGRNVAHLVEEGLEKERKIMSWRAKAEYRLQKDAHKIDVAFTVTLRPGEAVPVP